MSGVGRGAAGIFGCSIGGSEKALESRLFFHSVQRHNVCVLCIHPRQSDFLETDNRTVKRLAE